MQGNGRACSRRELDLELRQLSSGTGCLPVVLTRRRPRVRGLENAGVDVDYSNFVNKNLGCYFFGGGCRSIISHCNLDVTCGG